MSASRFVQTVTAASIRAAHPRTIPTATFQPPLLLRQSTQSTPELNLACRSIVRRQQRNFTQSTAKTAYRRQTFNYQTFKTTQTLFRRWRARPTFIYEISGIGVAVVIFYVSNLEHVPVSNRLRFRVVPYSWESSLGESLYKETMQQYGRQIILPTSREHRLVQRVLERLVPHAGLPADEKWEIHVIDSAEANAFVIPGGKVFVFKGILDVCGYAEDGVAAVLGHEIAHNVAHHAAERLSTSNILGILATVGLVLVGLDPNFGGMLVNLAFTLPGSRQQEAEADYIGLLMMAEACYDPSAAMRLWGTMEAEEKMSGQGPPPAFLSTHPSSHNRLEKIRGWLPMAEDRRAESECASTIGYGE
ncbi:hypothetical protein LTR08_006666 [Meristemomyces frigidus]|nr:hypothetical protein LTR08_006666 [Meristemomyces frigidus]